jgi:Protein of unknown function (DUF1553)
MSPGARTPWKRAALADWITDVDRGAGSLLARVIVNRLWQHHFEQGLVATPNDFGHQGAGPTHPELLEWLADQLIQNHWRLKPIHKLIMTSAVYMQDSSRTETAAPRTRPSESPASSQEFHSSPARAAFSKGMDLDPDNQLLWRYPRHRLEAEIIRDAILAVSGRLDPAMFGPGSLDEGMNRRSIYFTVKRSKLIPMMIRSGLPAGIF